MVKLGTITPTGADVYSYAEDEDDLVSDPHLASHLAHWGINTQAMQTATLTLTLTLTPTLALALALALTLTLSLSLALALTLTLSLSLALAL